MNLERLGIFLRKIQLVRLALVLIAINILVFALLLLPGRNRIVAMQSGYARLRSEVLQEEQNIRQLKDRLAKLQQAQKDLEFIYSKVLTPKKTGVTDVRLELESLVRGLQVEKRDLAYTNQLLPDFKLRLFRLALPVEGSYSSIRRFINNIERSKYFLILDRVDLSSEQKGDTLRLDFTLSTYLVEDET